MFVVQIRINLYNIERTHKIGQEIDNLLDKHVKEIVSVKAFV